MSCLQKVMTRKGIYEGERIPRGYGIAYGDFASCRYICYPIPLHLIVRLIREVYFKVQVLFTPSKLDKMLEKNYRGGFEEGYKSGRKACENDYNKGYFKGVGKSWEFLEKLARCATLREEIKGGGR